MNLVSIKSQFDKTLPCTVTHHKNNSDTPEFINLNMIIAYPDKTTITGRGNPKLRLHYAGTTVGEASRGRLSKSLSLYKLVYDFLSDTQIRVIQK